MKFFSTHRATRSTAFVVLLVWLFALAAGVANACLLEVSPTRHNGGVTAAPADVVPVRLAGDAQAAVGYNDDSGASKAPCLTASDDGFRLAPKAFSRMEHTEPGPAPVTAVQWSAVMAVPSTPRRIARLAPRVSGLPIQLRFARLAL